MYMELAKVQISSVFARVIRKKPIPKGIIGATVCLNYTDPAWKGLTKTVVFEGSGVTKDIPDAGEVVQVPAEVVTKLNSLVKVGVYGTDADNGIAIPTLWAELGYVRGAADPSGDEAAAPELPIWAQLAERVEDLEKNVGGEVGQNAIKDAVEDYFEQNPVEAPVQSVNGKTGKVNLTAGDVGAISQNDLQKATDQALAQAKESGEFDGKDGYTPVKGTDYYTAADKTEMVNLVLAALPTWTGGNY